MKVESENESLSQRDPPRHVKSNNDVIDNWGDETASEIDLATENVGADRTFVDISTIPRLRVGSVLSIVQMYVGLVNCLRSKSAFASDRKMSLTTMNYRL